MSENKLKNMEENIVNPINQEILPQEIIRQKLLDVYEGKDTKWLDEVCEPFSETELTNIFFKNAYIFFDELIQITENNRERSPEQVTNFLKIIHKNFFTISPSISNSLSITDMLIVSAKVNRVEEMRGFVGQNMVGEFLYEVTFTSEDISEHLISKIENLPNGLREEVIDQLETCSSYAIGNGDWAEPGADRIKNVIKNFCSSSRPLTRIVAEVAMSKLLADEEDELGLGVFSHTNNKDGGRLSSFTPVLSVEDKINSNLPLDYRAVVVARDTIIGIDRTGMARYGGFDEKAVEINNQPSKGISILKKLKSLKNSDFDDISPRSFINTLGEFIKIFELDKGPEDFYVRILNFPKDKVLDIFNNNLNIVPFLREDWRGIIDRLIIMVEARLTDLANIKSVKFDSFNQLIQENVVNPFDVISKEDTVLLTQCLRPEVRGHLEEELGVSFSEISFRAEMALIRYISKENSENYEKLCIVLDKHQNQKSLIIETFVDCAKDTKLGEKIISLCEKLDEKTIQQIFSKYLELVSQLNKIGDILQESYGKEGNREEIAKIKEDLLKKGKDLLTHFADLIEKGGEISSEEITKELESIKAETVTYFLTFKILKENKELPPIGEILGLSLSAVKGGNLLPEDIKKMAEIYSKNYSHKSKELLAAILEKFAHRAEDDKTKYHLLKFKGEVVGFLGFTEKGDNTLHMHSVNIDLPLRGMSIGDTLMNVTINQAAKDNIIKAESFYTSPVCGKYIEMGFVGISSFLHVDTISLNIIRDDQKIFETKQRGKEEFVKEYLEFELAGQTGVCNKDKYIIVKAPTQDKIDISHLEKGYVLTRYFSNGKDKDKMWYAVFEKSK